MWAGWLIEEFVIAVSTSHTDLQRLVIPVLILKVVIGMRILRLLHFAKRYRSLKVSHQFFSENIHIKFTVYFCENNRLKQTSKKPIKILCHNSD